MKWLRLLPLLLLTACETDSNGNTRFDAAGFSAAIGAVDASAKAYRNVVDAYHYQPAYQPVQPYYYAP